MADIVQDIVYEGDNSTFVWKSPVTDFNTGSQITVRESQEALFYMNGQALDLFGPGRHTLETQNIPLVRKFLSLPTGGQTSFHCEVYFINKVEQLAIKWGLDSKVEYMDPMYEFPVQVGARGEMSLTVSDARKLLVKVVGTEDYLGQSQLVEKLRFLVVSRVKQYLARTLKQSGKCIYDIDEISMDIADALKLQLAPDFADYGIDLTRFAILELAKPETDPNYRRFKDLHAQGAAAVKEATIRQRVGLIDQQTQAQQMIIEAQGLAQKRQLEGYTYQQEQSFEVSKLAAQNEGAGNFSSAGIGLGMMTGIAGGMGATVAGMTNNALSSVAPAQFQQPAAPPPPQPVDDMAVLKQKIEKLKMMKDSGLISDDEWEAERKKLLSNL